MAIKKRLIKIKAFLTKTERLAEFLFFFLNLNFEIRILSSGAGKDFILAW